MNASGTVREEAPAKINLGLHVLARRGDGYHEIDTLMVKLELADVVTATPASDDVTLEITSSSGPGFHEALPVDDGNLAVRAARLYLDALGRGDGVRLELDKRVPIAAGLGGGSSDAAAALRAVARLFPASVDLAALGLEIGSDVPFFLQGAPAARARGRGEKLEPRSLPRLSIVLANPGVPVSAAEAYGQLLNFAPRLDPNAIATRLEAGGDPEVRNALQPGVMRERPEVREALMALRGAGLRGVLMSGSGATCFGIAEDEDHALRVEQRVAADHPDWWVHATRTRGSSVL